MENRAVASDREWDGGVANCGPPQVKEFVVPADNLVVKREEVYTGPKIIGISVLAIYRRSSEINLERLRHDHRCGLQLEPMGEDRGKPHGTGAFELGEPPEEVLSLQRV